MYTMTDWKDHVTQYPNRRIMTDNSDGTVTLNKAQGTILQQGTPQSAKNFNNMESGVFDAYVSSAILLQYFLQFERESKENDKNHAAEFLNEVQTVTLTNTQRWPFNNSQKTIDLQKPRKTMNYDVVCEVDTAQGNVGDIAISDKQLNGFKIAFDGSAASITVTLRIKGGMLV